jgi:phage tail sheath protein FI
MPAVLNYPGVYIEELPSGVRTITGVATSITAFVGRALRGPVNDPVRVQSFAEFERTFGGLWVDSTLGYAVSHFFLNGGADALIVRVAAANAKAATATVGSLPLVAASPGSWGKSLTGELAVQSATAFKLTITDTGTNAVETYYNLSLDPSSALFVTLVLAQQSNLVRVDATQTFPTTVTATVSPVAFTAGNDGADIGDAALQGNETSKTGLFALAKADLFNLLCIPPLIKNGVVTDIAVLTRTTATTYCEKRRAMFIADPLIAWDDVSDPVADAAPFGPLISPNAALYFPMIVAPDPLRDGKLGSFAPCGAVAGVMARTDATRGVWKAPAGTDATLTGVSALTVKLTDGENGQINPKGINCLRVFPVFGPVAWGARTLKGADAMADQWKYIPVRRLALYIEESLYRGTQWVVFEPNDEPLWAQIRLNIGAFMNNLFRQGAFQGSTPRDAYFVACDKTTTTQNDIDQGVVNIIVGFAPLKPAEFVVIKLQQIAGQLQT